MKTQHPHINKIHQLYENETQPFRKIHRLVDLFESLIKTYTAVIVADYFQSKKLSDKTKALLAEGMRVPSLGIWHLFNRELLAEMENEKMTFFHNGIYTEYMGFSAAFQIKGTTNIDKILSFRNGLAHGATPSDELCSKLVDEMQPLLNSFIALPLFHKCFIIAKDDLGNYLEIEEDAINFDEKIFNDKPIIPFKPYLAAEDGSLLELQPLLTLKQNTDPANKFYLLVFFNDLKKFDKKQISLLHYPQAMHLSDKDYFVDFIEKIPVHEWKQKTDDEFKQRIDELTEDFKGRIEERNFINQFINKAEKGFMMVYGNPGIGKSALLAQITKEIKQIPQKSRPIIIDYFIRRGTSYASPERMLDHLNDSIERHYNTKMPRGNNADEKLQYLISRFKKIDQTAEARHLIIIIDGLDEGIEEDRNIIKFIPIEITEKISFIFGSRQISEAEQFYDKLPHLHRNKLLLGGLKKEDVRALLYDIVNKYAIEEQFIENIVACSAGNPLYIRMLCLALEEGDMKLNDSKHLPAKLNDFYKEFIAKYSKRANGNILLQSLYVFAASKDFITTKQLQYILNIGEADAEMVIYEMREVLFDNPVTEEEDFQLFHESFREYLVKEKNSSVREAELNIIKYCRQWNDIVINDQKLALYPFKYFSFHLMNLGLKEELMELAFNQKFISNQLKHTHNRDNSFSLLKYASQINSEENNENALNLFIQAIKFHKESALNKNILKQILVEQNTVLLSSTLNSFATNGFTELATIIFYMVVNELFINNNQNSILLIEINTFLTSQNEKIIPLQFAIGKICSPKVLQKTHAKLISANLEQIIKLFSIYNFDNTNELDEQNFEENVTLTINKIEEIGIDLFDKRSPDYKTIFESFKIKLEANKNKFVHDEYITIPFKTYLIVYLGFFLFFLFHFFLWTRVVFIVTPKFLIELLFDKEFKSEHANEIRENKRIRLFMNYIRHYEERLGIGLKTLKKFKVFKNVFFSINSIYYSLKANQRKFNKTLSNIKNNKTKSELLVYYTEHNLLKDKNKAKKKIDEALKFLLNHFEKKRKKDLAFKLTYNYDINKIEDSGLEESIGEIGRVVAKTDEDLFNTYMSKIKPYYITADSESSKPKLFKPIIEGFFEINNYKKVLILLEEFCECEKFLNIFNCFLILNEYRSINYSDSNLISKAKRAWSNINDDSFKNAFHVGGKINFNFISIEMASLNNWSLPLDFHIENKEFIKTIKGGDITQFFPELNFGHTPESLSNYSELELLKFAHLSSSNSDGINDNLDKSGALKDISIELAKQGKMEEAATALHEALECARDIKSHIDKDSSLKDISNELFKQGKVEEALACARSINDNSVKSDQLKDISIELAKQMKMDAAAAVIYEALEFARGISSDKDKIGELLAISTELSKQGKTEEAAVAMHEALECAHGISDVDDKNSALKHISNELFKQGKFEEALACAHTIKDNYKTRPLNGDFYKNSALQYISIELAKQGKVEEALECANTIKVNSFTNSSRKVYTLKDISSELSKQGKTEEAAVAMQQALACTRDIADCAGKSSILRGLSIELAKQGKVEEALEFAQGKCDGSDKSYALWAISAELAKQGKIEEALACAHDISVDSNKSSALRDISSELFKQGKVEESLACARGISGDYNKSRALRDISAELSKQGEYEKADSAMKEAIECALGISDGYEKNNWLNDITTELSKQGKFEEALACAKGISDKPDKISALKLISAELSKQGKIKEAINGLTQEELDNEENSEYLNNIIYYSKHNLTVEYAKKLEENCGAFFFRRDCLNNIKPAVYWDYMIQCEGEKFEFYLYFFQKFLVKHNALEEYFPKILPYIINDKEALLKMGYRLAYHATQKNANAAFNKIQFNQKLNQIIDLSIILND